MPAPIYTPGVSPSPRGKKKRKRKTAHFVTFMAPPLKTQYITIKQIYKSFHKIHLYHRIGTFVPPPLPKKKRNKNHNTMKSFLRSSPPSFHFIIKSRASFFLSSHYFHLIILYIYRYYKYTTLQYRYVWFSLLLHFRNKTWDNTQNAWWFFFPLDL